MLFIMGKITKIIMFVEQRHTHTKLRISTSPDDPALQELYCPNYQWCAGPEAGMETPKEAEADSIATTECC